MTPQDQIIKLLETTDVKAAFVVLVNADKDPTTFVYGKDGLGTIGLPEMEKLNDGLQTIANEYAMQAMYIRNTQNHETWEPQESGVCPRRAQEVGAGTGVFFLKDGKDYWRNDHTCTYCGSLKPEKVLELLKDGAKHERASGKNYKGYLSHKSLDRGRDKFYIHHFTADQIMELNRLINGVPTEGCSEWPPAKELEG